MQRQFDRQMEMMMEQAASGPLAPSCFSPVLLAVSGGVDSMTLAELFYHSSLRLPFALAHCNFSLRGEESDGDEALVTAWAEAHEIPLFKVRFDTVAFAQEKGLSIEMAARQLRYEWFGKICRTQGFPALAVAHNANDDVETLFLNLLRGTGMKGLSGMAAVGRLPLPAEEGQQQPLLLRPLLDFTRKQIEGFAFAHGISWREDHTNAESSYKRNRLRNQVFPLFEKINPSFLRTLQQEMRRFSDAEEILTGWALSREDAFLKESDDPDVLAEISISAMMAQPHWPYLLYKVLDPYGFPAAVLSEIEALLRSGRTVSGKIFMAPHHELVTTTDRMLVRELPDRETEDFLEISAPGIYTFRKRRYEVKVMDRTPGFNLRQKEGVLVLDAATLPFPFWFRSWRNGDWFIPFGMNGKKKVSDYFTDRKYSRLEKEKAAMLVRDLDMATSRVSAVLACRTDDSHKVGELTGKILLIRLLP